MLYDNCVVCSAAFEKRTETQNKKYCSAECSAFATKLNSKGGSFFILDRDGCRCVYCGATPGSDNVRLVLDHIIPHSKGGEDTADNLVACCEECNLSKNAGKLSTDTDKYIKEYVTRRNVESGLPGKKVIKGSHCRDSDRKNGR